MTPVNRDWFLIIIATFPRHPSNLPGSIALERMSRRRNNQRPLPRDRLFQKMSEVISLREQVVQAELTVKVLSTAKVLSSSPDDELKDDQ
jgi:hypothetical protein